MVKSPKTFVLNAKPLLWLGALAFLLFYFFIDPMESRFVPQCVFHKLTGYQCMGCGAQRMLHSLLHGDIKGAFEANAFLFCCLPFLAFMIYVELGRKSHPSLYKALHSKTLIITSAALLFAWLLIRNIFSL